MEWELPNVAMETFLRKQPSRWTAARKENVFLTEWIDDILKHIINVLAVCLHRVMNTVGKLGEH